jgi:hypothetical protein
MDPGVAAQRLQAESACEVAQTGRHAVPQKSFAAKGACEAECMWSTS